MRRFAWNRGRAPNARELLAAGLPLLAAGVVGMGWMLIAGGVS